MRKGGGEEWEGEKKQRKAQLPIPIVSVWFVTGVPTCDRSGYFHIFERVGVGLFVDQLR